MSDAAQNDLRILCELVLALNRQGFGRLRCYPQFAPSGTTLRCCIAISPLTRPSTSNFWEPIWWYRAQGQAWTLPPAGTARRNSTVLAAERGANSFLACVIGNTHASVAVGDSGGYDDWLAAVLARPERVVPVLLWDWYETPVTIETIPRIDADIAFPPGFFTNNTEDWKLNFRMAGEQTQPLSSPREGVKMQYLIRRKAGTSFAEMAVYWFSDQMMSTSNVMMQLQAANQETPVSLYTVSLFDSSEHGAVPPFDGVAQIHFPKRPPPPSFVGSYTTPTNTFMRIVCPYESWATTEYVLLDPRPLLHEMHKPHQEEKRYPVTRSGFIKITVLLVSKERGADQSALFTHLVGSTAPRLRRAVESAGGFGCILSCSDEPARNPFVAMLELYFHSEEGWMAVESACGAGARGAWDMDWVDPSRTQVLNTTTELVGFETIME